MFLIFGILVHVLLGIGMRLAFRWNPAVIAVIFAAKELGELKYKLPGSVNTLEKNITMIAELLTNPPVVSQWLLPAVAAWTIARLQRRQRKTFATKKQGRNNCLL